MLQLQETVFFQGDRLINEFVLGLNGDKATLSCAIKENWTEVIGLSLRCGTKYRRTVRQRFGVTRTDREDLDVSIKGSLGLQGIASLQTAIKARTGKEIRFDEMREIEQEFTFEAPQWGQLIVSVYQLRRVYEFGYEDNRWFSLWDKPSWTKTVTEWLERIHDGSKKFENDPECGCGGIPYSGNDGEVYLDGGRISMRAGYRRTADGFAFPTLGVQFSGRIEDFAIAEGVVKRELVPTYLLFLADEVRPELRFRFVPDTPDWMAHYKPSKRWIFKSLKSEEGFTSESREGFKFEIL